MCLDAQYNREQDVVMYPCHNIGGTQYWEFDINGVIGREHYTIHFEDLKLIYKYQRSQTDNQVRVY